MQENSIALQSEAIALYAACHGLKIVRSYEDHGRSGLSIDRRSGLQRLINDVKSGYADFQTILIYDVSRWGRFQDTDESAYYEFTCRSHGVAVEYCAEDFNNDGSLTSSILKALKRAMAGEFSRELSAKVFKGQSRVVADGYRIGSTPGYGLRRAIAGATGMPLLLERGQWKAIQGQHTILVPGPESEVAVIRQIFSRFVECQKTYTQIARDLNNDGVRNAEGRVWTSQAVKDVLTNEKYIGNSVYNRASKKLGRSWVRNPRRDWVVCEGAYEPLVSIECFRQAGEKIRKTIRAYQSNFMLDVLSAQWCCNGKLSEELLMGQGPVPAYNTFKAHFGSLTKAYELIGYPMRSQRELNLQICREIRDGLAVAIRSHQGNVRELKRCRFLLANEQVSVAVGVGRTAKKSSGGHLWQFGYRSLEKPDLLIVARVENESHILDYFVLPFALLPAGAWVTLSGNNYLRLEQFRFQSLEFVGSLLGARPVRPSAPCFPYVSSLNITKRAINAFGEALASEDFSELCRSADIHGYPTVSCNLDVDPSLQFVTLWRFLKRLSERTEVGQRLKQGWPRLMRVFELAFVVQLEQGPFPKMMFLSGRPPKRPFAAERAARRLLER